MAPDEQQRGSGGATVVTALILLGYLGVLGVGLEVGGPLVWLVPSVMLLFCTGVYQLRRPMNHLVLGGGLHAGVMAALCGLLVGGMVAFALVWPPRPTHVPLAPALTLVLLVPLAEELYFRGLLLDVLHRLVGKAAALVASSLLFGLLHLPQGLAVPMTVLALVLGLAALWTRSVVWAAALHVVWNALATLRVAPADQRWALVLAACVALAVLAAWGVYTRHGSRGS